MNPYPKDKVVLAWDEDSFVGGANDYIEFYTLDEAKEQSSSTRKSTAV